MFEVYNSIGTVITKPCSREVAESIAEIFNDNDPDGYTYAIRAIVPHAVYEARVNPENPGQPDLLRVVAHDVSQAVAQKMAWAMTTALGDSDTFYTTRINPISGPVRRYTQMPWGELVPDFS